MIFERLYNNDKTVLTFHKDFNQSLDSVIFADSLQTIIFGRRFNQPLDNTNFPCTLQVIIFGSCFNQPLNIIKFPLNFRAITFGQNYKQSLDNLPCSLEKLTFYSINNNVTNLPISVTQIKITEYNVQSSIKKLLKIPYGCKVLDAHDNEIKIE
ncbi:MAG: hypothetical protein Gaeavirus2_18 [Gaeavirus sp.]|uniref:FNIP repeat-containing protein n=1 Tax=Gaeavirus sp. TaxID=2487767 RepID=A0A3G4ZYD5_9VIRU|nr:MAG: hypothetical protein Gaeavirus2_18 [Gaeavirus sp.]